MSNKQDEFPKTYAKLKELYYEEGKTKKVPLFYFFSERVLLTEEELLQDFSKVVGEIQQPIWSLCEDLLSGNYKMEFHSENKDKSTIVVADQEFSVNNVTYMYEENAVTPDVAENGEEYRLLASAINEARYYELHGKFREELLYYYKGE